MSDICSKPATAGGGDLPGTGDAAVTYEIVYEEQAEETKTVQKDAEVVEWNSDSQIYWKILEADPEQIHFKSRLLTMLKR
ncbi:MAG: hypothetical protein ACLR7F_02805 [Waltera sp.]